MTRAEQDAPNPAARAVAKVARVVTDVAGIDKDFDYLIPEGMGGSIAVGTEVRVPLHGRRVGGWIVDLRTCGPAGVELRPLAKVRGVGPDPDTVELAGWAAWRWAAKRSWFLKTASAGRAVPLLPSVGRPPRSPAAPPRSPLEFPTDPGVHILRLAPAVDPTPLVAAVARAGPLLVVVPTAARAAVLAARLRRAGGDVALLPADWARARAGAAAVVIGTASAAWGPCPGMAAAMVLDAHDEGLTAEGAPTWSAVTVMAERARRAAAPLYAISPCPTPELVVLGRLVVGDRVGERSGWAPLEVIDRRADDPRLGLWSERLVQLVRAAGAGRRVALVLNRAGRIRLLACAACGELARCEVCAAAVGSPAPGRLHCPRCGQDRPAVCGACGSTRLKALRIGVDRAREEIETLAGRPVGEVTATTGELPAADVIIGTEAVLRRFDPSSGLVAVGFVDFDQELLAPRLRATDEALALLALAARLVRGRTGRLLVQTRLPEHPAIRAAAGGDPGLALEGQDELRRGLRMPPYATVAVVHGDAAPAWTDQVCGLARPGVEVIGPDPAGRWMVKAADPAGLCDALAAVPRPATGILRVAVEPGRL